MSEYFKAAGHDFGDRDGATACRTCGMLYLDFLRDGGGCVSTGPHVTLSADGREEHAPAALTARH